MATATAIAASQRVPDGWRWMRLGDVADVAFSGVDKKTADGELPVQLCNYTDVFYNHRISAEMDLMSATATTSERDKWSLKAGDVLFTKDSETPDEIGIPSCVIEDMPDVLCGYHLGLARPIKSTVEGPFLSYALGSAELRRQFSRIANGITRFGLTLDATKGLPILPPLPEQRAIAAVLDSIEDAIEGAEAVIAATEQLRDSLLHDLLTRGLPGKHTEFRDVPGLGTIPADWEVVRLGDVIPKFEYGTSVKSHVDPFGSPVLRIPNIARGELDLRDLKYTDLSPSELEALELCTGDILLVRTNGNPEICGRCWVVEGLEGQWAFASYIVRGRVIKSEANPAFVGHFLSSASGRRLLRGHIRTSAGNYNLSVGNLGSIPLPCPTLDEQKSIVKIVARVNVTMGEARAEMDGLQFLKESTADALLTGRVRGSLKRGSSNVSEQ